MLNERIHTVLTPEEMVTKLQQLGCDVEGYATLRRFRCGSCQFLMEITETEHPPVECQACGKDFRVSPDTLEQRGTSEVIRMELLAVRPDMFDPAGLARTLRGYLGEYLGLVSYALGQPKFQVEVQAELFDEESPFYRPIRCAIVRGVKLDEDRIKVLMKLQENLHWAMARDRKRAAIGVYDLNTIDPARGIYYRLAGPEELSFIPLGKSSPMTLAQVLKEHAKGKEYAHLLGGRDSYPLLESHSLDGSRQVMAFIPIINSEATKVTSNSCDLFIDVTGLEERLVEKILNTILTSILELCPGSTAECVSLSSSAKQAILSPDLSPQEMEFDPELAPKRIGVDLDSKAVVNLLLRMGHAVEEAGEHSLLVKIPAYRNDILHPVDLAEDIAIAYGYHNISPRLVPTFTVGWETPRAVMMNRVRQILTGLGYFEVLTLILSSETDQFTKLSRKPKENYVSLSHPISQEQTMIRTSLLPGLLDTFSVNIDHPLPQRIFEVGRVSLLDSSCEVGAREELRVAAALIGSRVDFADIKAVAESLLRELGAVDGVSVRPLGEGDDMQETVISGRGAVIEVLKRPCLVFGEVHPEVLEAFDLANPVAFLEMDLEAFI